MKHIILTGSTMGLGKALKEVLIKEKFILHLINRKNIRDKDMKIYNYMCDLEKINEISMLTNDICKNIQQDIKELIIINNAGIILPIKSILKQSDTEILRSLKINEISPILLIKNILSYFEVYDIDKRIINITSGAYKIPIDGWSNYCVTKASINMFLKVLKKEEKKIKIVSIDPGIMDTKMQEDIRSADSDYFCNVDEFIKFKLEKKLRNPVEVADYIKKRYILNWNCKKINEMID